MTRTSANEKGNVVKSITFWHRGLRGLALLAALAAVVCTVNTQPATGGDADTPRISSIRIDRGDVAVVVHVPAGVKKVTLESRTRLGAGAWRPIAVQRVDGTAKDLTFRFTRSEKTEVLRVRGDAQEALPASFYAGTNTFNGQGSANPPAAVSPTAGAEGAVRDTTMGTPTNESATRDVVESDIWKLRGDTLYFFNQYRGLQVIDLSAPDAPTLTGTLFMPAAGEQMYVLDDHHVLLMARNGCGYGADEGSAAVVVEVGNGAPRIVASAPVPGYIQESRLVGTALYVASQSYRKIVIPGKPDTGAGEQWEWGSVVSSIDLSDPTAPVSRTTLWYPGYGNVIMATDRFLFVVTQNVGNWWQSTVAIVEIAAADGTMVPRSTVAPAGRVADKFKLNMAGDVFTVVSDDWRTSRVSVLETFSLADPAAPRRLGRLEVGHGEGLFATRFDGNKVYIVTFLRIDPLWVVDLSDPANPRIAGKLDTPGWSTYIQPLGDRLVTIGIDNSNSWKVAVSLFDVRDPANPGLLAKVPLGENSSWSEANYDEKALTVLPGAGLILVPYATWSTNGYASRVQLIDLGADTLTARGVIEHSFQPRRATVHQARIVSISGRELLGVNATDRDHPVVSAQLDLSWAVNRVVASGEFLVEISDAATWYGAPNAWLRVVSASDPERVLNRLELTNGLPLLGASARDGKLYLAQGESGNVWWRVPVAETGDGKGGAASNKVSLVLTVFDLAQLPALAPSAQTTAAIDPLGWGVALQPLWPKPGLLVWSGGGYYMWAWGLDGPARRGIATDMVWWPWWGGGGGGRLLAFDVANASAPKFVSDTDLTSSTNGWWSFSSAFATDGLVYSSHQGSEFLPDVQWPGQPKPTPIVIVNPDGSTTTNIPPVGIWVTRYYLDVVDYADPLNPTVRKPVNIPGALQGLSHGGALLYTTGPHWDTAWTTDWTEYLDASAYDGVAVSLVTSRKLANSWPRPLLVQGPTIWLGNGTTSELEAWAVNNSGQFAQLGATKLALPAQNLAAFGNLLAVQLNASIELYDVTQPALPARVGGGSPAGCLWPDLGRATGSLTDGLWVPLQDYGLFRVSLGAKP